MLTQEGKRRGIIRAVAIPALLLAGFLAGCSDENDDPAGGITAIVSFAGHDGNALTRGAITSPPGSEQIVSLIVGAVVITHDRNPATPEIDPYTAADQVNDEPIPEEGDKSTKELLKDDAIQSAAYLTIEDLPLSADVISFLIPPAGAGSWQLVGVGTRTNVDVLQDLEDDEDAPIWYGFSADGFQNDLVEPGDQVELILEPGCNLPSPPTPGC
jgi:hypothetical protein